MPLCRRRSQTSHPCFSSVLPKDWNTFLLRFNDLDLCVSENETLKHLTNDTTAPESTVTSGQARTSTQSPQPLEDAGPVNISVAITLTLDPLKPFGGYSRNVTHLYSTILGHQIGLSGTLSGSQLPQALSGHSCYHTEYESVRCPSSDGCLVFVRVFPFVEFEPTKSGRKPFYYIFTYSSAWYAVGAQ